MEPALDLFALPYTLDRPPPGLLRATEPHRSPRRAGRSPAICTPRLGPPLARSGDPPLLRSHARSPTAFAARLSTRRVQVDIPHQFQQIRLPLAQNGFEPVLVQPTGSAMPTVEVHGVPRQQPLHRTPDRPSARNQQQENRPSLAVAPQNRNPFLKPMQSFTHIPADGQGGVPVGNPKGFLSSADEVYTTARCVAHQKHRIL